MSSTEHELSEGAERRPSHSRYRHVIGLVSQAVWAIQPVKLAAIIDVLSMRASGQRFTREEIEARIGEPRSHDGDYEAAFAASRQQGGSQSIAVLRLMGMIAPRQSYFEDVSSPNGTSVERFTQALRSALADPSVGSVLIDIDSPGGIADMVPELAAEIRVARGDKPIVAIANTMAASAAYWIGSQADELVVTPSGEVGSIGVYAAHEDMSGYLEQEGLDITLISAGPFKTEANPFEPLSDEARAAIQERVDEIYGAFLADVAKGRGTSVKDVRENFGQGRVVSAAQALAAGMVDRVETFDQVVGRMARGRVQSRRAKALADASFSFPGTGGLTASNGTTSEPIYRTTQPLDSGIGIPVGASLVVNGEVVREYAPGEWAELTSTSAAVEPPAEPVPAEPEAAQDDEPAAAWSVEHMKTILEGGKQ